LPINLINESKRLLPDKNYVGFSISQGNTYRLKSWSIDNFITLANKYISVGKKVVFFIEKKDEKLINYIKSKLPSVILPESESKISSPPLVTALATRLEKTITIDNGTMHMISLAGTPMITLFGPTNSKKFSPDRKNVKVLDSKILYKSDDISKISVEDVFNCS
jgi:ADP-heptose:LPS heptosyltransferase